MLAFVVEQHTYLFSWSTSKSLFAPPSAQSLISTACHARSRRSLRMGWFTMMRAYFFVACPLRSSSQVHVLTGCAGMAAAEVEMLCIAISSGVEKSCNRLRYVMQYGRHHVPMSSERGRCTFIQTPLFLLHHIPPSTMVHDPRISDGQLAHINAVSTPQPRPQLPLSLTPTQAAAVREYAIEPRMGRSNHITTTLTIRLPYRLRRQWVSLHRAGHAANRTVRWSFSTMSR